MVNAGPRTEDSNGVIESEELKLSRDEENMLGEGGFGKESGMGQTLQLKRSK